MQQSHPRDRAVLDRVDQEWLALVDPPQVTPRKVRDLGSVDRRWSSLLQARPRRSAVAERYFLDEILDQGEGFTSYRARHAVLGQPVALTLLGDPASSDARVEEGLRAEAADALRVQSSSLLPICDLGRMRGGQLFFARPLPDAPSLAARLAAGPLGTAQAIAVVRHVAAALAQLHDAGIVHHDLRPEHVFVAERSRGTFAWVWAVGPFSAMKRTPHATYAAPEQRRGALPSVLSNVWSLAALACAVLSDGRPQEPQTRREPTVLLAPALRAALDPDPAQRPASVGELAARLLGSAAPVR